MAPRTLYTPVSERPPLDRFLWRLLVHGRHRVNTGPLQIGTLSAPGYRIIGVIFAWKGRPGRREVQFRAGEAWTAFAPSARPRPRGWGVNR